jgi:hypothetical protein
LEIVAVVAADSHDTEVEFCLECETALLVYKTLLGVEEVLEVFWEPAQDSLVRPDPAMLVKDLI